MPPASRLALRDRIQGAVSTAVGSSVFWAVLVALIAAWPIWWALRTPVPPRLPILGTVPQFEGTAADGAPFGSKDLAGRVWLASFISTRRETVVTRHLARIQARSRNLEPAFHLVSFTVDADDPPQLAAYAREHRASPRMWTFLTGPGETVREALSQGTKLVLIDGEGRIRARYDAEDPDSVERVVRDAALLVNRG
jgi:protein SCO1